MNCRNFETIIIEMARGQMLEARAINDANIHLASCKLCTARFRDEQALGSGLRLVAASAAKIETPARVEAALLSTFRQHAANHFTPISAALPPARPRALRRWSWSVAAAAAILAVVAIVAFSLLRPDSSEVTRVVSSEMPQVVLPDALQSFPDEIEPDPIIKHTGGQRRPGARPAFIPVVNSGQGGTRTTNQSAPTSQNVVLTNNDASNGEEVSTEFLPLTHGSSLAQMDDGQIVRVELPRSALHSFGLPVNAERAGERVKADVLLGYDGVARAIRFIK